MDFKSTFMVGVRVQKGRIPEGGKEGRKLKLLKDVAAWLRFNSSV